MAAGSAWIGPAVQGSIGIGQMAWGEHQRQKAMRMLEDLERPEYEIPPEILQNLSQAEQMALEGLPAEQKKIFTENIQRATLSGQTALQERGLGVAGVSALAQQETDAYRQLLGMDVAARREGQAGLAEARSSLADFRETEFVYNKLDPYQQSYLEAQAMLGAGTQALFKGSQTWAESSANFGGIGSFGG